MNELQQKNRQIKLSVIAIYSRVSLTFAWQTGRSFKQSVGQARGQIIVVDQADRGSIILILIAMSDALVWFPS